MFKVDYHIHTSFSADSRENIEDIINRAINLEINEIAITDHFEIETGLAPTYILDIEKYIKSLSELKIKYEDKIKILLGVEVGYSKKGMKEVNEVLEKYKFDFIISSIHSVGKFHFLNNDFFEGKSKEEAYTEYFNELYDGVKTFKNYDVIGHLDFICRYGKYENKELKYEDYKDIIDKILKEIINTGKGIEINTSAIKYGRTEFYPSNEILLRYRELGGKRITIGSDSHKKEHLLSEFENAIETLKALGFKGYSTFENRKEKFKEI